MKTIASITILLFVLSQSNYCQIKVLSNGNVGIDESSPTGKFCVGTTGSTYAVAYFKNSLVTNLKRTLQVNQEVDGCENGAQLFGIVSYCDYGTPGSSVKLYSIYGSAYRNTNDNSKTFGVWGRGGGGADGYNYGVSGILQGDRNGTGVYGAYMNYHPYIDGQYAGVFVGDVHIEGDLTVSGNYPESDIRLKKDVRIFDDNVIPVIIS